MPQFQDFPVEFVESIGAQYYTYTVSFLSPKADSVLVEIVAQERSKGPHTGKIESVKINHYSVGVDQTPSEQDMLIYSNSLISSHIGENVSFPPIASST